MRDEIQNSQVPPSIVVQKWAKTIKNKSNVKCNFFETAKKTTIFLLMMKNLRVPLVYGN